MRKIFFLISFAFVTVSFADTLETKQNELKDVTSQIQVVKKSLDQDDTQEADTELQLKVIEMDLADLSHDQITLNEKLAAEEKTLAKLKLAQDHYLAELNKQSKALAEQTRTIYQLGRMQSVKTILNPDNLTNLNRHLYYYHNLGAQRLKLVNEVKQIIDTLKNNMQASNEHQTLLQVLVEERVEELTKQQTLQKQKQDLLAQIQQTTQTHQQQLNSLTTNQQALLNLLDDLRTQEPVESTIAFDKLQGKLHWPLSGKITLAIDDPEINQHLSGLIIKSPAGTPVHAISNGKVIFANNLRGFGLLVIISHGNGYMSLYARNQTLFAKQGDTIHKNDVVAASGNSGGYATPGLYFEIRQNGSPVDPHKWCS